MSLTKDSYENIYKSELTNDLQKIASKNFLRLLLTLCDANRNESTCPSLMIAHAEAEALKSAGVDRFKTNEAMFIHILCMSNHKHVQAIRKEYVKLAGRSLDDDIKKSFTGNMRKGLRAVLLNSCSPRKFFAQQLYKALNKRFSINDRSLVRIILMRSEIDLENVKNEFLKIYGKTLKSFLLTKTAGECKIELILMTSSCVMNVHCRRISQHLVCVVW
jgi:hypothetical protein